MNAAGFLGRLFPGFLSQRFGVKPMVAVTSGCGAALIFAMMAAQTTESFVVIGVLYGFFTGSGKFLLLSPRRRLSLSSRYFNGSTLYHPHRRHV